MWLFPVEDSLVVLRAGTTGYTHVADSTDIAFDGNVLHVAAESGSLVNDIMNEDGRATVFDSMGEVMSHKHEQVSTTRWFQYVAAVGKYLETWALRCCICFYCSIQLGLFHQEASSIKVKVPQRRTSKDPRLRPTKQKYRKPAPPRSTCILSTT